MVLGENLLSAVFRRRSSSRDLTRASTEEEEAPVGSHDTAEEEKEEEESQNGELVTAHFIIEHAGVVHDGCDLPLDGDDAEEDLQQQQGNQEDESVEDEAIFCINRAAPVKDSLDGSSCFGSSCSQAHWDGETSSANDSSDAKTNESGSVEKLTRAKTKAWKKDAAKLGWTPGRVKRTGKDRLVLEPVVALTDALEEICLDDSIIRAMAGKRGSFSSEISAVTEESDGSEGKRARVWSVFRMRGGSRSSVKNDTRST